MPSPGGSQLDPPVGHNHTVTKKSRGAESSPWILVKKSKSKQAFSRQAERRRAEELAGMNNFKFR